MSPLLPTSDDASPHPATSAHETLRLARELEGARGQVQALENRLQRAGAEVRQSRALHTHWWTRLGRWAGCLPRGTAAEVKPTDADLATEAEWLPTGPPDAYGPPATLDTLQLLVRRLRAEAREREIRHAEEAAAWRRETTDLEARAYLEDYRREVRRRLRREWPGWAWKRAVRFTRVRARWLRRRLSHGRLRR